MKVHGTEIPAVVKQNNKGQTASEPPPRKGQQQKSQQQHKLQQQSRERGASHEDAREEQFKSPDSVKSEITEEGVASGAGAEQGYSGSQQPGYIMTVPGESLNTE